MEMQEFAKKKNTKRHTLTFTYIHKMYYMRSCNINVYIRTCFCKVLRPWEQFKTEDNREIIFLL